MAAQANVLSVHVPEALQAGIERLAEERNVGKEQIVSEALARYIEDETEYHDAIHEALTEVEAGIFVSGEKVLEWVKSWGTDNELPIPQPDIFPDKTS